MTSHSSSYDKHPTVTVPGTLGKAVEGWDEIAARLRDRRGVTVVECYPGIDEAAVLRELASRLKPTVTFSTRDLMKPAAEIDALVEPYLGGDDPIFGRMNSLELPEFFEDEKVSAIREAAQAVDGSVLIVGVGASLVHPGDTLVYADLARWEAQLRFRRNASSNLGVENAVLPWGLQYKRAFFVDWRVADRWKCRLMERWDYVLDTNLEVAPKLAEGAAVRAGLEHCLTRPFRVVPFFDPAPWGGQWMKEVMDLDPSAANFGWCFDCVPEENSLVLRIGGVDIELPSINLVLRSPRELLGQRVFDRFGAEFPIRFDLLDTMDGGNLSFQVHPTTQFAREAFGIDYTQEESYYLLDAGPEGFVYLGLRPNVDPSEMIGALRTAQAGGEPFDADRFANRWPSQKHDHFLIPPGTVHCSGKDTMVLEISATPYIFTFKLWDWGRLGLDGKPRPINLDRGEKVIDWSRDTEWTKRNLINRIDVLQEGDGWREERTGLHETEFIETRRHWFTGPVRHETGGSVNVLNLVAGEAAVVESDSGEFEPFVVHYAETFIVPANVDSYTIRPVEEEPSAPLATLKAFVRE